jgi:hypothetical protein
VTSVTKHSNAQQLAFSSQHSVRIRSYMDDERLQGSARLAKGPFVDAGFLPSHRRFSEGRDVWINHPDTPVCSDGQRFRPSLRKVAKRGNGEFERFLNIACGSASELEDHFLLARDLVFVSAGDCQKLNHGVVELKRMLAALAAQGGGREARRQSAPNADGWF